MASEIPGASFKSNETEIKLTIQIVIPITNTQISDILQSCVV